VCPQIPQIDADGFVLIRENPRHLRIKSRQGLRNAQSLELAGISWSAAGCRRGWKRKKSLTKKTIKKSGS